MSAQKIFIWYSDKDKDLAEILGTHLAALRHYGFIDKIWHSHDISAGTERQQEISNRLNDADFILLLISAYFLSEFGSHSQGDMRQAFERHKRGEAHIIPILLRYCDYEITDFSKLQILPRNHKPVTAWRDRNQAFNEIVTEFYKLVRRSK